MASKVILHTLKDIFLHLTNIIQTKLVFCFKHLCAGKKKNQFQVAVAVIFQAKHPLQTCLAMQRCRHGKWYTSQRSAVSWSKFDLQGTEQSTAPLTTVSLTEAKICCNAISKFILTPTSFWGSNFKSLDQLALNMKRPRSAECWPNIYPGLTHSLGVRGVTLRWFVMSLVTPQSHLACCSRSLTAPQLTEHLVNSLHLPSGTSCVCQTSCQCFPPVLTLQKTLFQLSLCTTFLSATLQGLLQRWKQPKDED